MFKFIKVIISIACLFLFVSCNNVEQGEVVTIKQDLYLHSYMPFNSDVAKLDEASNLKIKDKLPVLDGATALYPLYSAFVQATYPESIYDIYDSKVMCNGTTEAYDKLINGKVDLIFAARPSERQLARAKKKGLELKLTPIGYEAFVFFVNSKNKVNNLSVVQIEDIYSGYTTNWKNVGGKNKEIIAFQRQEDSGSQTMLEKIMSGKKNYDSSYE